MVISVEKPNELLDWKPQDTEEGDREERETIVAIITSKGPIVRRTLGTVRAINHQHCHKVSFQQASEFGAHKQHYLAQVVKF